MKTKFPRHMLEPVIQHYRDLACSLEGTDRHLFVGGSYVREQPFCGDLDLVWAGCPEFALSYLREAKRVFRSGKVNSIEYGDFGLQVDLWLCEPKHWGTMCMFVAGSSRLNILQRKKATNQGFILSQYSLKSQDKEYFFDTEQEVYVFLGWNWLPYPQRQK